MIISLDFWGTIATPNPKFEIKQAEALGIEVSVWRKRVSSLQNAAKENCLQEKGTASLPPLPTFYPLEGTKYEGRVKEFMTLSKKLFNQELPIAMETHISGLRALLSLRSDIKDLKVGIVSNTLGVTGKSISNYLHYKLNLNLDFFNYSNEAGCAMPNPKIFLTRFGKVGYHVGTNHEFVCPGVDFFLKDVLDPTSEVTFENILRDSPEGAPEKIKSFSYSNHQVSVIDKEDFSFSFRDYSRMKYGSKYFSKKFGYDLAEGLYKSIELEDFLKEVGTKDILVTSEPYKFIPKSSRYFKEFFTTRFNILNSSKPISGNLNLETLRLLDDTALKSTYVDKALIVVQELNTKGSKEEKEVREILKKAKFSGPILYVYYVEYIGEYDPSSENLFNLACLDVGLLSIESIVSRGFLFNSRVVRYIMGSESRLFQTFISTKDKGFVQTLYSYCVVANYRESNPLLYEENINYLKSYL
jgi:hypothetical protein